MIILKEKGHEHRSVAESASDGQIKQELLSELLLILWLFCFNVEFVHTVKVKFIIQLNCAHLF